MTDISNYLPQDKVASFAAMAPPQLLQETMGAAGNPNLLKWHGELVNKGKEYDALCDVSRGLTLLTAGTRAACSRSRQGATDGGSAPTGEGAVRGEAGARAEGKLAMSWLTSGPDL